MKKILFCFSLFLCYSFDPVIGQELLNLDDSYTVVEYGKQAVIEAGKPIVFVPEKKEERPISIISDWKPNVGLVQIKPFGGQVLQVPNLTHIPYFFVFVQVLSDKSVVVTERITLILDKQQKTPFERSYLQKFLDLKQNLKNREVKFLWAKYNGRSIQPKVYQDNDNFSLSLFDDMGLFSGVHSFEISYLVPEAVTIEGNISHLFIPLLGTNLPYLTERMQILVAYPKNSILSFAKAYFGSNNQSVEDAYSVYVNENNHLIYKLKGILPTFADVRLHVVGDSKAFITQSIEEKLDMEILNNNAIIIAIIISLILFLYFHFSALDLLDKRMESSYLSVIRSRLNYDLGVLRYLRFKKVDEKTIFSFVLHLFEKKALDIRFNSKKELLLLKRSTQNHSDKRLLNFLFPFGIKRLNLSKKIFKLSKQRHFVLRNIYFQILNIVRREILVGLLLLLLGGILISYLKTDKYKIIISFVVIIVAYFISICHFIRKGRFKYFMLQLLMQYASLPRKNERILALTIALELNNEAKKERDVIIDGEKLNLMELEELFLSQLKVKGVDK